MAPGVAENEWLIGSQISPDEMKIILDAYTNSGHVLAEGFKVNGTKYTVLKVDGDSIYAKQVLPETFLFPSNEGK